MTPARARLDLEKRIAHAIGDALELAQTQLGGGGRVVAEKLAPRIFESEPDLMREAMPLWAIEKIVALIRRQRREQYASAHPQQMVLDDPVFRDLPRSVFLRDGRRPRLDYCTVKQTEDHLKLLRERLKNHPRINQMESVVNLHRKWAKKDGGITWGDAKRREAEERMK